MSEPTAAEIEQRARKLRRAARRASIPDSAGPADAADFERENEDREWPEFAAEARAELMAERCP